MNELAVIAAVLVPAAILVQVLAIAKQRLKSFACKIRKEPYK